MEKKSKKKINLALRILIFLVSFFVFILLGLMLMFKIFVMSFKDDVIDLNLTAAKMRINSTVYSLSSDGSYKEYQQIFSNENRIWVDFAKIPRYMKDAIVAIEDKRFYHHGGVDPVRVSGAVFNTLVGKKSYGGSSLTQQLIKNVTEDSEITFSRKIREMARAVRLEERYSKDEILESYLNVVNFGAGTRGVQAASSTYFGKDIWNCSIAECTAIAAITQNPSAHNPFVNPENNKKRRNVIIDEMFFQKKISKAEYEKALKDSENIKLSKPNSKIESANNFIRNWYVEMLCKDIIQDIANKYKIKKSLAEDIFYSSGLKIYSCIDPNAQRIAEETIRDSKIMPKDPDLELGFLMLDYSGKILASIGSSKLKTTNFVYDRANTARRQPGSIIKPIAVYAPAVDLGIFNYSSKIPDKPLRIDVDGSGNLKDWPENWYKGYKGEVTLQWALEKSANAPAAQILKLLGTNRSYKFLTQRLGLSSLDISDSNSLAALAAGGTHVGVTVKEITSAFQIFGSGGKFFKPKSYLYVTDKDNKIILDNRDGSPKQVISEESAYILNRLMRQVIVGPEGTGRKADIPGKEIIGKTGTTTDDFDSWFIGLSPSVIAGIWIGYDRPKRIKDTSASLRIWKNIMTDFLLMSVSESEFLVPENVVSFPYCIETGLLSNSECLHTSVGYYAVKSMPSFCSLHGSLPKKDENLNENLKEIKDLEQKNDQENNYENRSLPLHPS